MALHLLVVDDRAAMCELLSEYFIEKGFEVSSAGSMREAREASGKGRFELAIVDLELPDGDGKELVPALKSAHPGISIFVYTATKPQADELEWAVAAGVDTIFHKPISPDELFSQIVNRLFRAGLLGTEDVFRMLRNIATE